jgi:hypothetical protein
LAGRGLLVVGEDLAAPVAGHRLIGVVGHEVGAGRVEEQQVDLEVQQRGDRPKHLPLDLRCGLDQPVHRPVALVLAHPARLAVTVGEAGNSPNCLDHDQGKH